MKLLQSGGAEQKRGRRVGAAERAVLHHSSALVISFVAAAGITALNRSSRQQQG
jgi:hypothetical protein